VHIGDANPETTATGKDHSFLRDIAHAQGGNGMRFWPQILMPSKVIVPCFGGTIPIILLRVVVLPMPLRPRRVTNSPFFISEEIPFRM
jgi:hypothetical protein